MPARPPPRRRNSAALAYEARRRERRAPAAHRLPAARFWELLRSAVRRGTVPAGTLLVEGDLLRCFDASRSSVRTALRLLAEEGLVAREIRTGTAVVTGVAEVDALEVVPGSRSGGRPRLRVRELLAEVFPAPALLAEALEAPAGEPVLRLEQIGELDDRPVYLRSALLPLLGVSDLHERVLRLDADPRGLTDSFTALFTRSPGPVQASVTALPAGRSVARHLGLERGAPVLVREMVLRDDAGALRELSTTYCRGDAVSMTSGGPGTHGP